MKNIMIIICTLIILYGIILAFFYFSQSSMLFFPQPLENYHSDNKSEEVIIKTPNGNKLHGWFCKSEIRNDTLSNLLIYFGGNAEEVSHLIPNVSSNLPEWSVLLINYPGYGLSEGKPSEKSFFDAALAIFDYGVSRQNVNPESIVLLGRSIGTGCAVYLARKRNVSGVVLVSPFESMSAVAQSKLPYLPVSLLLKHKFESIKYTQKVDVPMLAFYGTADKIVPPKHTKKLAKEWKGEVKTVQLEGYNHNNMFESENLWNEINKFLRKF